jgi:hypothetical protein
MNSFARAIIVAAALALPLGGCVNFDPQDWLAGDWFQNKKPLPGERKDLFPGGVPGVSRGVPPDLVKGNQAAALQDQQEEAPQVRLEEPKPKPKPKAAKPKPKPKVVEAEPESRPTPVTVRPQPQAQPQAQPRPQQGGGGVQWPDPPGAQRPQPQGGGVQWPDPPSAR